MIDLSYIQSADSNTQVFQNGGTWQTWVKPKNAKLIHFMAAGSGAGGGGGYLAPTGTKTGGGAGGSGATTRLTLQANLIPDILYIYAGKGGLGGIGGITGTASIGSSGQTSFVCLIPNTGSMANVVLRSGTTPSVGGTAGSTATSAGGAAEIAVLATIQSNGLFVNLGHYTVTLGVAGTSGGAGGGTSATVLNYVQSATGGGGTAGGGIQTGTDLIVTTPSSAVNTNGTSGLVMYKPLFLRGGSGAGGGTTGGKGGNGAPSAGGGGGGAGTTSAGTGGKGGDGFVIITTNF
jgi:hypothetical protein